MLDASWLQKQICITVLTMFTMVNCTVKAIILETVAPQNKEQIKKSINIFPGPQSQKERQGKP